MFNKKIAALLLIFAIAAAPACVGKKKPEASGKAVWDYITEESNYKNWELWPGKGELYPGQKPHGAFLTTYVNDEALSSVKEKKGKMEYGSIIVKENYMPDKTLAAITVMYKVKGYDPENNDWFYAKYSPKGEILAEGKVESCRNCHGVKKDNDYIFTGELK